MIEMGFTGRGARFASLTARVATRLARLLAGSAGEFAQAGPREVIEHG